MIGSLFLFGDAVYPNPHLDFSHFEMNVAATVVLLSIVLCLFLLIFSIFMKKRDAPGSTLKELGVFVIFTWLLLGPPFVFFATIILGISLMLMIGLKGEYLAEMSSLFVAFGLYLYILRRFGIPWGQVVLMTVVVILSFCLLWTLLPSIISF